MCRKLAAANAVMACDLYQIKSTKDVTRVINSLADVVIRWNTKKVYSNESHKKSSRHGNCHDFVMDLLDELGIKLNFNGVMKLYLDRLRKKGKASLTFSPTPEMRNTFSLKKKRPKFNTHEELDRYVNILQQKSNFEFETSYPEEWLLLKAFDRAFWLRHKGMNSDQLV